MKILNIAAGKFLPLLEVDKMKDPYLLVNLDTMYYQVDEPAIIEKKFHTWTGQQPKKFHCNVDAFEFMERTRLSFDRVVYIDFLNMFHFQILCILYILYQQLWNQEQLLM